ncbi:short chain dehydrogenase/reductase family [Aulographum hederae CBS 113979]|uniref:Short chain dehydrogenase/reductase family n=1 Tax=Aulographum hederae CBS 113979 TaxID=1176131 RepID=A0A6G1GKR3_9PEZI|nr:short chain dehydrogenase/reductase family [Aulographum hederae CBS 113979]
MAKALAANGASKVYIIGRRKEILEAAAAQGPPGTITPVQGDVTSKESLSDVVEVIKSETGHINLLIANSGIVGPPVTGLKKDPSVSEFRDFCWNMDSAAFTDVYNVNNTATFFTVIAFLELLDAGNKAQNTPNIGSQVIITSSAGAFARNVTTGIAYVTSKCAANHLAKIFATMLAPFDIRCNALAPGFFPSEMQNLSNLGGMQIPKALVPAGRAGTEEDMVGTVLWMTSRAGAYVNGCIILADGGRVSVHLNSY